MIKRLVIAYTLFSLPAVGYADTIVQSIGNILGEFSTGVGAGATKAIVAQQAQWITIAARPKAVCIAESGNVINTVYVRCRNGRQEFVRFDANGQKIVLSERPIPLY